MFYVYTTDGKDYQRMPLSELADALRSLLTQPAPADVAALTADRDTWRTACELAAGDVSRITADRDAWRDIARGMSPASPDVAALDAAKQRAELQLADARQEIEQLRAANAEMYRTMTEASTAAADAGEEVCRVRAELDDARRLQGEYRGEWIAASTRANQELRQQLAAVTGERDQMGELVDTFCRALADAIDAHAAELGAARSSLTLTQIAVETVTADRDEWREAALASAHKVAVAREALDA